MIKKKSSQKFFIVVAILIVLVFVLRHKSIQSRFNHIYRMNYFNTLQTDLESDQLSGEKYWEFRERFSAGHFSRDIVNTAFFTTFRIVNTEEDFTPLFTYQSPNLQSVDGVLNGSFDDKKLELIQEYPGEVIYNFEDYFFIRIANGEYLLAFSKPIEEMKQANGLFDYRSGENELLEDQSWYNITRLTL